MNTATGPVAYACTVLWLALASPSALAQDTPAYPDLTRSVVELHARNLILGPSGERRLATVKFGTAVAVRAIDGACLLATAHHVVTEADKLVLIFSSGRSEQGELVGVDEVADLAIVQVPLPKADTNACQPLPLAPTAPALGQELIALGNGSGYGIALTKGVASRWRTTAFGRELEADIRSGHGFSGGPLLNSKGEAVGLITTMDPPGQGTGLTQAVPAAVLANLMRDTARYGRTARLRIGVQVADTSSSLKADTKSGLQVVAVTPGSPADKAGVRPAQKVTPKKGAASGDIILEIGGEPVSDLSSALRRAAETSLPGTKLALRVTRAGADREIVLELPIDGYL